MSKLITISSFSDLLDAFDMHPATVYRGVSCYNCHKLIPSIGRNDEFTYDKHIEAHMFRLFKEKSIPFLSNTSRDDWEFLALAQHYKLPTRLLDWTWNPFVAVYFSVKDCEKEDGAVYTLYAAIVPSHKPCSDPLETSGYCIYNPPHFDNRIVAQSGLFTCQEKPDQEFPTEDCDIIIIPKGLKKDIRHKLRILNIHTATLFPSLEGVAYSIREDPTYN
ncbi:MAG: FRG domain-containing protein [Anaerolineaceae bacterium]|nr:FRG domain-containing protein [Anaerolineaceae bacterium]